MSLLKTGRPSKTDKAIAAVQDSKEESIRMNINIPKSFYKQIKQISLNRDITIKEFVLKALHEYMSK